MKNQEPPAAGNIVAALPEIPEIPVVPVVPVIIEEPITTPPPGSLKINENSLKFLRTFFTSSWRRSRRFFYGHVHR
jgi:hypothetical protein